LWLIQQEGYHFVPSASQAADFEALVKDDWNGLARRYDAENDGDMLEGQQYRLNGIAAIYTFAKDQGDADAPPFKVQIIEAETNPLQCILGFHSRSYRFPCSFR